MGRQLKQPGGSWDTCPAGEIVHLSQRLRKRRQRRVFLKATAMLTSTAAVAGGVWLA